MCGLAGWIGSPDVSNNVRRRRANTLEALMMCNISRGDNATGIATVFSDGSSRVLKQPVPSTVFVNDVTVRSHIRERGVYMAMGHTRLGTMGANSQQNAHPFIEQDVIGAHNGIIWNWKEVEDILGGQYKRPLAVDSQVIFRLLAENPSDVKSISEVLPLVEGSMTITWVDKRHPDRMYAFKHENPLSLAIVPSAHAAFWSSEIDHLAPTIRASFGKEWYQFNINENTLYELWWEDEKLMYTKTPVKMPKFEYSGWTVHKGWKNPNAVATVTSPEDKRQQWERDLEDKYMDDLVKDSRSLDDQRFDTCDMCSNTIDYVNSHIEYYPVSESDGYVLCASCGIWWENHGQKVHNTIGEAIVSKLNGWP